MVWNFGLHQTIVYWRCTFFFDCSLNISQIHNYISELEKNVRVELSIDNLDSVFIHSEPIEGRIDGILFNNA